METGLGNGAVDRLANAHYQIIAVAHHILRQGRIP